ncbi:tetratricopeptide repeat protein [Psychroflexus aestuariivivens]|uniref:tetratricopeptide repeat protein n=1 Tax=Psychroflexus aestuariivivens TaxID=1795040 RepID=UPI000FDAB959|nr:tetratricopeptide repeat protein [Psychroflexus aestuariivivens]
MKTFFSFIIFFGFALFCKAGNPKIDSLKVELNNTKVDTLKVKLLNDIAYEFINVSFDSILPYTQKAIDISRKVDYQKGEGVSFRLQSIYYFYLGQPEISTEKINQSIEIFESIEDYEMLAKTYNNYGILLKHFGDYDSALQKFKLARSFHEKSDNLQGVLDNLINVSTIYSERGDLEKASNLLDQALEVNKKLEDKASYAAIVSSQGVIAEYHGDFKLAKEKFKECLELFKEMNRTRSIVGTNNNLANIARKQGYYLESITYFEDALAAAREINNPRLESIILNNLANNYFSLNEDDKALELYIQSSEITKNIDINTYASTLTNIAMIEENKKNFDKAIKNLQEAYEIFEKQDRKSNIALNLHAQASIKYGQESYTEAKGLLKRAERIVNKIKDEYTSTLIFSSLARVYQKENKIDSAYYYSKKSYDIAKTIGALLEHSDSSKLLYEIHKAKDEPEQALKYLETHLKLKDSLFDKEKSRELGKLEAELGFKNLTEKLNYDNDKKLLKKQLQVERRENYIIYLSIVLGVLLLLTILLLFHRRNKNETNKILLEKNKEIQIKNNKLNESNDQKNKLFSIISHDLRSPLNSLSQLFDLYNKDQLEEKEIKAWLPEINKNIESTKLLIDNLLNWASESLNQSNIEKQELNLFQEVQSKNNFFDSNLKQKGVKIINKVDENFEIFIDQNSLKIVLRNLISNAIKFTDIGDKITISAIHKDGFDRVCVQDTGLGMSQEVAESLFKKNNLVSAIGTKAEKGKGIGTLLCKNFIEENDGLIWVDFTEIDKGTRICFEVPSKPDTNSDI